MTFAEKIAPFITLENAKAWDASSEKWCWVDENILTEINHDASSRSVNMIEARLERVLISV